MHQTLNGVGHAVMLAARQHFVVQNVAKLTLIGRRQLLVLHVMKHEKIHHRSERLNEIVSQIVIVQLAVMMDPDAGLKAIV